MSVDFLGIRYFRGALGYFSAAVLGRINLCPRGHKLMRPRCPASTPLADWRQSSWPVSGSDRPEVVAGDDLGAMAVEATRKLSHTTARAIASTGFL
jgi:hypothetical protein